MSCRAAGWWLDGLRSPCRSSRERTATGIRWNHLGSPCSSGREVIWGAVILVHEAPSLCTCTCSAAPLRRRQRGSGLEGAFKNQLGYDWWNPQTLQSNHRPSDLHGLLYLLVLISIPECSIENADFNSVSFTAGFQGLPLVVSAATEKLSLHLCLCHTAWH